MPQQLLLVNPAKRRRSRRRKSTKRRARGAVRVHANPIKRRSRRRSRRSTTVGALRRRFRRNPSPRFGGGRGGLVAGVQQTTINGAIGAVGGVAVDALMKLAPVSMKTGMASHLTRATAAIALGVLGNMIKLPFAGALAQGAMTIALYGAAREYVTVPMGLSEYTESDVAEISGLAYANPAQLVDGFDGDDDDDLDGLAAYQESAIDYDFA